MRISDWSSDVCSSDLDDVGDLVADVVERTYGRLSARTRTLDAHFQRLHAVVERGLAGLLGGDLGCERGRLARTAEARAARSRPRQRVALAVGDGDDGVVERSMDVGDAIGDDALALLLRLGSGWFGHVCRSEEHTSELQSLMRISYAVFCLQNKSHIHVTLMS